MVTIDTGASVPDWEDVVVARKSGVPALRHAGLGWRPGLAGGCSCCCGLAARGNVYPCLLLRACSGRM